MSTAAGADVTEEALLGGAGTVTLVPGRVGPIGHVHLQHVVQHVLSLRATEGGRID